MRIVCEKTEHRQWCAWVEGSSGSAFTAETAPLAVERLIAALPGVSIGDVEPDNERSRVGRYVFLVGRLCSDCRGSGRYVGLVETGDCATCGGSGRQQHGIDAVPF